MKIVQSVRDPKTGAWILTAEQTDAEAISVLPPNDDVKSRGSVVERRLAWVRDHHEQVHDRSWDTCPATDCLLARTVKGMSKWNEAMRGALDRAREDLRQWCLGLGPSHYSQETIRIIDAALAMRRPEGE